MLKNINLKTARVAKDLRQYELADLLGVKQSAVSHWESGRNYPTVDIAIKIAEILDKDVVYLFKKSEEK